MTPELAFALGYALYPLTEWAVDRLFRAPRAHEVTQAQADASDPKIIPFPRVRDHTTRAPERGRGA